VLGPAASVCVVGSVNMDLVVRAQRIPQPGETVLGGEHRSFPGGKGANQAVAAARMGSRVAFIGAIGDDAHGALLREALAAEALDLSGLIVKPSRASGLALITLADSGENAIVVSPGANAELREDDLVPHLHAITSSDVLLMQLEVPLATVHAGAAHARGAGRCVVLNAAPARHLPVDLLRLIDVIVVNRAEAARILAMDAGSDAARMTLRLSELGPTTAIMTMGSQGAILAHRGRPRRVPTPHVKAIDTVGAGDAFCGALAAAWGAVHRAALARDPREFELVESAVVHASAAGALASTRPGALPAMPRREEVERLAIGLRVG
jgi:ribokinase